MSLFCFECRILLEYIGKDFTGLYLYSCPKCKSNVLFEPKGDMLV